MRTSATVRLPARRKIGVALALLAAFQIFTAPGAEAAPREPAKWVTLSGCRFMTEESSDGDSFHVKYGQREFIFRLYFVDAPEKDESLRDRVKEQCEHFGVTIEEHRKGAEAARKFTAEWLKRPFTVTTRWQNAMGRSRLPRYYAQIDAGGQDLAAMLVSRGLARAKGTVAILPDGTKAKDHLEKLRKLEREAREKRLGLWENSRHTEK